MSSECRGSRSKAMETMESTQCPTEVVLLSCGSFNPITNMHVRMFELARRHLEETGRYKVVKGIISPVGDGYKKKGLIEARHRVKMAQLAVKDSHWITVDPWESRQPEWMETAKVARHHYEIIGRSKTLQRRRNGAKKEPSPPPRRLMLLCGADVLASFKTPNLWKEEDLDEILGVYGVVCVGRHGTDARGVVRKSDALRMHRKNIHMVPSERATNKISSTRVRQALLQGQSVKDLTPDPVVRYIQRNDLYTAESERRNAGVDLEPLQRYTDVSASRKRKSPHEDTCSRAKRICPRTNKKA